MKLVDRSSQKMILFFAALLLLRGLYLAEYCYRAGAWVVEMRGLQYTGSLAVFIICAMVVLGAGFVITSLRNLSSK